MSGKAVRETLAALGVIASLVFVGMEVQQNTSATRGQTRQALADVSREWLTMMGQDAEVEDLWYRAWRATRSEVVLTAAEVRRAENLMRANLRRLENVHLQQAEGLLDDSALNAYGFEAGDVWFTTTQFRSFWNRLRDGYDPAFVAFFDQRYGLAP